MEWFYTVSFVMCFLARFSLMRPPLFWGSPFMIILNKLHCTLTSPGGINECKCKTVPLHSASIQLCYDNFPGPVPHFRTVSNGKLGTSMWTRLHYTIVCISQLGNDVSVVLIVCAVDHISNILTAGKDRKRRRHAPKLPIKRFCTRQNTGPMPNWSKSLSADHPLHS